MPCIYMNAFIFAVSGFASAYYWSSTENNNNNAWKQNFDNGNANNNIPINYEVNNENDSKAMGDILTQAVEILGHNEFTALFDKGYHTGSEFETAENLDVEVLVAVPDLPSSSMAPDHAYNISEFTYNKETDTYTCPQGNTLKSNGK